MPLDDPPRVGEGPVLLGEAGGRQPEHFGLDRGRIGGIELAVVLPELGGFGRQRIDHHQVFQLGQRGGDLGLVRHRGQRVEALADEAVHLALVHPLEQRQHVVGGVLLRQPVVAEPVLRRGGVAVPGLHQAGVPLREVLREVHLVGPQRLGRALGQILLAGLVRVRRRAQIARQHLGVEALVGDALHVGVAAQRVDAAARHAQVAQQQLDHGHGADVLRTDRVLGPAQGVADGHGPVGRRGLGDQLADLEEVGLRRPGDLAHHLRRVAGVMPLQDLEHAVRTLQGLVHLDEALAVELVLPGGGVVLALGGVVAREQAVLELEALVDQEGGVGERLDVLVMDFVVGQQVVNDPAQEGDVAAGANAARRNRQPPRSA